MEDSTIFHPLEGVGDCPVDIGSIREQRHTFVEAEDPSDSYQHQDNWVNDPTQPNCMSRWKGRTEFEIKPEEEDRPGLISRRERSAEEIGEEEERSAKRGRFEFPSDDAEEDEHSLMQRSTRTKTG